MTAQRLFELLERMRYEPARAIDARERIRDAFAEKDARIAELEAANAKLTRDPRDAKFDREFSECEIHV